MLQWKKKPGEAVAQDEILIEIETDKVVLEVPAPAAGVLAKSQNDGDTVVADQVIAKIDTEAKAGAAQPQRAPRKCSRRQRRPQQHRPHTGCRNGIELGRRIAGRSQAAGREGSVDGRRRRHRPDGRVTKGDALAAGSAPKAAPAAAPAKPPLPSRRCRKWARHRPRPG
jgi:2-oxoglutarate dehydrogenase E2 component (dihydrolipoamide succinyltransferase)